MDRVPFPELPDGVGPGRHIPEAALACPTDRDKGRVNRREAGRAVGRDKPKDGVGPMADGHQEDRPAPYGRPGGAKSGPTAEVGARLQRAADASVWIFDLDNTLYPAHSNLFDQVDQRMGSFIQNFLGLDEAGARALQKRYFAAHGTTMRGLMANHAMEPQAFLDYVHDIDLSVLPPADALDAALHRLPGRKIIFTNGSVRHAERITEHMGIADHFEAIFDIVASDYVPKPDATPYRTVVARHGIAPAQAAMVEDIARNLEPAASMGMTTAWVRPPKAADQPVPDYVHHLVDDLPEWLHQVADLVQAPVAPLKSTR